MKFDINPFMFSCEGGRGWGWGINDFKSGTFIGRFKSNSAASTAVKGLIQCCPPSAEFEIVEAGS